MDLAAEAVTVHSPQSTIDLDLSLVPTYPYLTLPTYCTSYLRTYIHPTLLPSPTLARPGIFALPGTIPIHPSSSNLVNHFNSFHTSHLAFCILHFAFWSSFSILSWWHFNVHATPSLDYRFRGNTERHYQSIRWWFVI